MAKSLLLSLVTLLAFSAFAGPKNQAIKFATFNIEFYGTGEKIDGTSADEYRDPFLRSFIQDELGDAGVVAFEEIVDPQRLQEEVLPQNWDCLTYKSPSQNHQHVVLCHGPQLRFAHEPTDNNDIIDDVAIAGNSKSRPAVHVIVTDRQGVQLARVVGVHLKAYPEESKTRQQQMKIIGEYLKKLSKTKLPVVVMGDFNSYNAKDTGEAKNDEAMFLDILNQSGLNMYQAVNPNKYTFRKKKNLSRLDHFYVSKTMTQQSDVDVFGMCNSEVGKGPLYDPEYYNKNISDHCPASVWLGL